VVGADAMSRLVDPTDRTTAVLFGDAAGAVVLERVEGPGELVAWETGTEPGTAHLITCDTGGTMLMEGQEVFRRGVRMVVESCERVLASAGVGPDEVALFVPHQANLRILTAAAERIGIDPSRVAVAIAETGNTSAASVPLALAGALDEGRVHAGDLLLSVGFGAGLTWATALTRWVA
jgi:3-oxoacyl-[acyl-carrier-protein] synthase-3